MPVEQVAHLPDVDGVEREVVEVRDALGDQRHHVVVGVDVEPDALCPQPVAHPHPEHLGVEPRSLVERGREEVDVAELARRPGPHRAGAARVRHPGLPLAGRHELDPVVLGVGEVEASVQLDPVDPGGVEG